MPRPQDPSEQPPGHLQGNMQWLVTRYPQKPNPATGKSIIQLGSILTDPADPQSSLNLYSIPEIPDRYINDSSANVRHAVSEKAKSDGAFLKILPPGILASIQGLELGAEAGVGREKGFKTTVLAERVKAKEFIPNLIEFDTGAGDGESKTYMDLALEDPRVKKSIAGWKLSKSLYMIVGVATAVGGVTLGEERSRAKFAGVGGIVALPAEMGEGEVSVEHSSETGGETLVEVEEECDFAYQVRRFDYRKISKRLKDKGNYTDGSLFGKDRKNEAEEEVKEIVLEFDGFDDEEEEIPEVEGLVSIHVEGSEAGGDDDA